MAMNFSTAVRNNMLDAIETAIGTAAILAMCSGAKPSAASSAETGTRLVTMNLPSDWMSNASAGAKAKLGTWQDAAADATGVIGYYRIYDSTGTTCHVQGTITATGGGGDMTVDNVNVATGQVVTVTGYTLTAGNP